MVAARLSRRGLFDPVASLAGVRDVLCNHRYGEANPRTIVRQPDQTVGADGFNAAYPAYSITLFVVPEGR